MDNKIAVILLAAVSIAQAQSTVVKTVGTASRDYSTITAWENQNRNLTTANEIERADLYDDSVFNERVVFDGWTTDATRYQIVQAATGERHTGIEDTGVRIHYSSTGNDDGILHVLDAFVKFRWLDVSGAGATATEQYGFFFLTDANGCEIDYSIIHDLPTTAEATDGVHFGNTGGASHTVTVRNTLIHTMARAALMSNSSSDGTIMAYNCSFWNLNTLPFSGWSGVSARRSDVELKNTMVLTIGAGVCIDEDVDLLGGTINNAANNMTSDATADDFGGTGHLINKSAANQFIAITGTKNFHIKSTADAKDAGTSTSANGVTDDIDGDARPFNSVYDMGFDEFVTAAAVVRKILMKPRYY